jgi:carbamoyl-phosphate synthase large subunit
MTVDGAPFSSVAQKIASVLRYIGNMDCEFLERDGVVYLLEMNPRFGGGYPFSHEAGANLVKALCTSLSGLPLEIAIKHEISKVFSKCDILIETDI